MMGMTNLWICLAGDKKLVLRCDHAALTAYEARQFGARKLGVDPAGIDVKLRTRESVDPANPADFRELDHAWLREQDGTLEQVDIIEVRWTGSDYSHGGGNERRRMQERPAGTEAWTDA